jgi:hypothetical protein
LGRNSGNRIIAWRAYAAMHFSAATQKSGEPTPDCTDIPRGNVRVADSQLQAKLLIKSEPYDKWM